MTGKAKTKAPRAKTTKTTKTKKAETKPKKTTKTKTAKVTKATKVASTKKVETKPKVVEKAPVEKKVRKKLTRDTVLESFDELIQRNLDEIETLRNSEKKSHGIKHLKSVNKELGKLRAQAAKLMKKPRARKNNTTSGFLKPVTISKELCDFTGWPQDELKSRVDVTKYICNYIKDNDLQNPEDKRQILVDAKLSKLLNYDAKTADKPLTYYMIQTCIKPHFV